MASVRLHGFAWLGLREWTCGFGSWHGVMAVNQWRVLEGRLRRSIWGVVHACMHAWQESQDSRMPVHHSNRLFFSPALSSSVHRAGIAFDQ